MVCPRNDPPFFGTGPEPDYDLYQVNFVVNADLPYDCVEAGGFQDGDPRFYNEKPKERPAGLPTSFVLVSVFTRAETGVWRFCGWFYLDAETVNRLHGHGSANPTAPATPAAKL